MRLIDARTVREQGVSSNPGPRVSASKQIMKARASCESVFLDKFLQQNISELCGELNIDGLRGDIVVNRAAKALAAFNGSNEVEIPDIAMVVTLCLRHRLRKDPLETMDSGEIVAETFEKVFEYDIGVRHVEYIKISTGQFRRKPGFKPIWLKPKRF